MSQSDGNISMKLTKKECARYFNMTLEDFAEWNMIDIGFPEEKLPKGATRIQAVMLNGENLANVPDRIKTEIMCLLAVNNMWSAIYYVPKRCMSERVISTAKWRSNNDPGVISIIDQILRE